MSRFIKSQTPLTHSSDQFIKSKTRNSYIFTSPSNISISQYVPKAKPKPSDEKLPSYTEALHSRLTSQPAGLPPPYSLKPYISHHRIIHTPPITELPPYWDVDPVRAAAIAMNGGTSKRKHVKNPPKNRSHRLNMTLRS